MKKMLLGLFFIGVFNCSLVGMERRRGGAEIFEMRGTAVVGEDGTVRFEITGDQGEQAEILKRMAALEAENKRLHEEAERKNIDLNEGESALLMSEYYAWYPTVIEHKDGQDCWKPNLKQFAQYLLERKSDLMTLIPSGRLRRGILRLIAYGEDENMPPAAVLGL